MSTNRGLRPSVLFALALGVFPLSACDDPLSEVEIIDKTRVIAAKIEVAGDATRAAPLPGEDVVVRLLVVAPELEPSLAYQLEACVAADSASDLTTCAGEPLATAASLTPTAQAPSIAFVAPPTAQGDERLAVLGAVCPSGVGLPAEGAVSCEDGTPKLRMTLDFSMDDGSHPNTNPALASVSFDGEVLPAETAATSDCAELPSVLAGSVLHHVEVEVEPSSRDPLDREGGDGPARESLLVSYFVSRGDLDHAWSALDSEDSGNATGALWTLPESVDAPSLARFIVVVRDGRGGSDFAERRLCIVPR